MHCSKGIRLAAIPYLFAGMLLAGPAALASQQALVDLTYKNQFFSVGLSRDVFTVMGAVVTVQTTAPTPSVMWPANILAGSRSFTYSGGYTPIASNMETYRLKAGTLARSHAGAASAGGSSFVPTTVTTKCFASIPPAAPGPPNLPGSCFPRKGKGMRTPGVRRFGGSARLLRDTLLIGTFIAATGYDLVSANFFYTPALTGPDTDPGNYGIIATGTFTNTVIGTARKTNFHETEVPFTTGVAKVTGGDFGTVLTLSGSHNFSTANLTGMISVVKPFLRNQFARNSAGNFIGNDLALHGIRTVSFTFLPEPATLILLACGALGLAALRHWDQ